MKGVLSAALIILALSIVRVAFPDSVAAAKEMLEPVARYGESLAEEALSIGKRLSGNGGAVYAWEKHTAETESPQPESPPPAPEGFELEEMISSNLTDFPGGIDAVFIPPETEDAMAVFSELEPVSEPEPDPEAEAQAEADMAAAISSLSGRIESFIAQQAGVTDLALPETICTEPVLLNFEYAAPCAVAYTSAFGYRMHPIYDEIRFHYGTDFEAYSGDAINAFANGTVIAAQEFDGYGQTIIIDHGNGYTTLYAHCSVLYVAFGDTVSMGQTIALVGQTGNVTGPHLHFELQKDGKYLNPEFYL